MMDDLEDTIFSKLSYGLWYIMQFIGVLITIVLLPLMWLVCVMDGSLKKEREENKRNK